MRPNRFLLLGVCYIFIVIIAVTDSDAQDWQPYFDGLWGGKVQAIAIDPDNCENVFVATPQGGIYQRLNNNDWVKKNINLPHLSINVLFIKKFNFRNESEKILFAGTDNNIWYLDLNNNNSIWKSLDEYNNIFKCFVNKKIIKIRDCPSLDAFYVIDEDKILWGIEWYQKKYYKREYLDLNDVLTFRGDNINTDDFGVVCIGTDSGLYLFYENIFNKPAKDGHLRLPGKHINCLAGREFRDQNKICHIIFAGAQDSGYYNFLSNHEGTWNTFSDGNVLKIEPYYSETINDIRTYSTIEKSDANSILKSNKDDFTKTNDFDEEWIELPKKGLPNKFSFNVIAISTSPENNLYLGLDNGIYKKSGATWDILNFKNFMSYQIFDLDFDSYNSKLFAVTEGGIFSGDGIDWESFKSYPEINILSLKSTGDLKYFGTEKEGVFEIDNQAGEPVDLRLEGEKINTIRIAETGSQNVYVGTNSGVYKLIRTSYNQKQMEPIYRDSNISDIAIIPPTIIEEDENELFISKSNEVIKISANSTYNKIKSWPVPDLINTLIYNPKSNVLFVGTKNGIYKIRNDSVEKCQEFSPSNLNIKKLILIPSIGNDGICNVLYAFGTEPNGKGIIQRKVLKSGKTIPPESVDFLQDNYPASTFSVNLLKYNTIYGGTLGNGVWKYIFPSISAPVVEPNLLDFVTVHKDESTTIQIKFTNKNTSMPLLLKLSIGGQNSTRFQHDWNEPKIIYPGEPLTSKVTFKPDKSGDFSANLKVEWQDIFEPPQTSGSFTIPLTGKGSNLLLNNQEADEITVKIQGHFRQPTPSVINFDKINPCNDFKNFNISIKNSYNTFKIDIDQWLQLLSNNQSDNLLCTYEPCIPPNVNAIDFNHSREITIQYEDCQNIVHTKRINLNGYVQSGILTIDPTSHFFGSYPHPDKSSPISFQISNIGNKDIIIDEYYFIDLDNVLQDKPFMNDLSSTIYPKMILKGSESCNINVYFQPHKNEDLKYQQKLILKYHDAIRPTIDQKFIQLEGDGKKYILNFTPESLNFGKIHKLNLSLGLRIKYLDLTNVAPIESKIVIWIDALQLINDPHFRIDESLITLLPQESKPVKIECISEVNGNHTIKFPITYYYGTDINLDKKGPIIRDLELSINIFSAEFSINSKQVSSDLTRVTESSPTNLVIKNQGNNPLYCSLSLESNPDINWIFSIDNITIESVDSFVDFLKFSPKKYPIPQNNMIINYWDYLDDSKEKQGIYGQEKIKLTGNAYDDIPPEITHKKPSEIRNPCTIDLEIKDEHSSLNKNELFIYYRHGGEDKFANKVLLTDKGNNQFQYIFPENYLNELGIEYFFEAKDISRGYKRDPDTSVKRFNYYSPQIIIPDRGIYYKDEAGEPFLNAGTHVEDYQLISIPLFLDNPNANAILESSLDKDDNGHKWRCADYDLNSKNYNYDYSNTNFSDFTPGKAFFLIVSNKITPKILLSGSGKTIATDNFYTGIILKPGWNLIGNPFNFSIPISCLRLSGDTTKRIILWSYEKHWIENKLKIVPWSGYAIASDSDIEQRLEINPDIRNPFPIPLKTDLFKEQWWLEIQATCQEYRDEDNFLATYKDASFEYDQFDVPEPPPFGNSVTVTFPHPEWNLPFDLFSTDIQKPSQDGNYWDFKVYSNISDAEINLTFKNLSSIPPHLKISLIGEGIKYIEDLRKAGTFKFNSNLAKNGQKFRILIGGDDFIDSNNLNAKFMPKVYSISDNYPNPFTTITSVEYDLPEPVPVTIIIYNLLGETIKIYKKETFELAGSYTVVWDGTDEQHHKVCSGLYFLKFLSPKFSKIVKIAYFK